MQRPGTIEEQILQKKKIGQARFQPPGYQNDMGKNFKSSKNIYRQLSVSFIKMVKIRPLINFHA